jgi:hypothetical protein
VSSLWSDNLVKGKNGSSIVHKIAVLYELI